MPLFKSAHPDDDVVLSRVDGVDARVSTDGPDLSSTSDPRLSLSEARQPGIIVSAVEKTFGADQAVHALGPIDLTVSAGEFLCVVGPSGCGKSTLLRLIAGLMRPSGGEIEIRLRSTSGQSMAMVFQDHGVYPWKTVLQNVRLGLDIERVPRQEANRRAMARLERLGLSEFADAFPHKLSGGMRQRVAIARAMALEPEVLLMDEPFAALDVQLRALLQEELLQLWQEDQRTVVFVTHSIDEALLLGDRIVVMSARPGRLLEEVAVPFERPRSPALRGTEEFARLEEQIWRLLRQEVRQVDSGTLTVVPDAGGSS